MQIKKSLNTPSIPNCLIPLGKGKYAIVDPADFAALNQYTWRVRKSHSTLYAIRKCTIDGKRKLIFMHRQIMSAPADMEVHHLNHNPLDNRRRNLILLTPPEHRELHHLSNLQRKASIPPHDQIDNHP